MKLRHIAIALVASLFVSCAAVDVTKTAKGFSNPTDPNSVEILKTRPERSYDELGTVTAVRFDAMDTAKMHNAIRTKSAALGANAVILTEEGILPNGRRWATGVALQFKEGASVKR